MVLIKTGTGVNLNPVKVALCLKNIDIFFLGAVEIKAMRGTDLVFDLHRHRLVVLQELFGVFTALPDAFVAIAEP